MSSSHNAWFADKRGVFDFNGFRVAAASTPELAAQIAREHNAALIVGGQAAALEPAELSS